MVLGRCQLEDRREESGLGSDDDDRIGTRTET